MITCPSILRIEIGNELLGLIRKNASVMLISRWADDIYSNYSRDLDPETDDLITRISFMQHGPEFELDKAGLGIIAKKLIG